MEVVEPQKSTNQGHQSPIPKIQRLDRSRKSSFEWNQCIEAEAPSLHEVSEASLLGTPKAKDPKSSGKDLHLLPNPDQDKMVEKDTSNPQKSIEKENSKPKGYESEIVSESEAVSTMEDRTSRLKTWKQGLGQDGIVKDDQSGPRKDPQSLQSSNQTSTQNKLDLANAGFIQGTSDLKKNLADNKMLNQS